MTSYPTHMRLLILSTTLFLFGASCVTTSPTNNLPTTPPAPPAETSAETPANAPTPQAGNPPAPVDRSTYLAYTPEGFNTVFGKQPVVLYFWASWCPICRAEEPKIQALIERSELAVTGFRVNFDTESAMKERYRVPYQHTTIILNSKGEEATRFTGPVSDDVLAKAISDAAL